MQMRPALFVATMDMVLPFSRKNLPDHHQTQAAAQKGDRQAQFDLGLIYYIRTDLNAEGQSHTQQAMKWFRKAALQGHADAQCNLGILLLPDSRGPNNPSQALRWLRKAAVQGHPTAHFVIGEVYQNGRGVSRDGDQALKWFRKASSLGLARAQVHLADLLLSDGYKSNRAEAAQWYRKAADQGSTKAQLRLADMYINGRGVPNDISEAIALIKKAAHEGSVEAQYRLGDLYERGAGMAQDATQAIAWFTKAARQNDFCFSTPAQYRLACAYLRAPGASGRHIAAAELLEAAARARYVPAQFRLGQIYYMGEGVPRDFVEAYKWFNIAAASGEKHATHARELVAKRMTPQQIAESQKESSELFRRIA